MEERHKSLVTDFTKRRNEIQAMQNSFTSFTNSVDRFFEWLFDVESTVEQLENDVEASPSKKTTFVQKFEDVKVRIFYIKCNCSVRISASWEGWNDCSPSHTNEGRQRQASNCRARPVHGGQR